jgi:hypothetical protein
MKITHYLSILAIGAVVFAGCKGDTGDTGPQGPSGVANIDTKEYSVGAGGWTQASGTSWYATFVESDITDNNNDAVEAYWSNSSSGWLALPFSNLDVSGDQLSYGFDNNSVTFSYYGNSNSPDVYTYTQVIYFKVTVIPPAIQVKYPGTNWKNAAEVAQIPEVKAALGTPGGK